MRLESEYTETARGEAASFAGSDTVRSRTGLGRPWHQGDPFENLRNPQSHPVKSTTGISAILRGDDT